MSTPIRVVIVDDEPLAREGLRLLLDEHADFQVIDEAASGASALSIIASKKPDLVFLDVQMPQLDGFEVVKRLAADCHPVIVFVTAYDRYALSAFEAHAIDYLVKPVKKSRFLQTLENVRTRVQERRLHESSDRLGQLLSDIRGAVPSGALPYPERFPIRERGRIYFVTAAEIDWVEAEDYYVRIHAAGKSHLLRESLTNMERKLDPGTFRRIHRSTIINLQRIKELRPHFQGEHIVILNDGTRLKLSRTYRDALGDLLSGQP